MTDICQKCGAPSVEYDDKRGMCVLCGWLHDKPAATGNPAAGAAFGRLKCSEVPDRARHSSGNIRAGLALVFFLVVVLHAPEIIAMMGG